MTDIIMYYPLEFVDKQCEYETIYTLKFKSETPLPFIAGQWLHLGFPTETKDKSKVRHMSISSAPSDSYLEFTMDLASDSWYKEQIKTLKPGDTMRAFKIKGEFVVESSSERPIVFISGGIGITPVRSIIRDLQSKNASVNWSLLHVSRTQFLYEDEFSELPNKQWHVHHDGVDAVWSDVLTLKDKALYYLCGSERFVEAMKERLAQSEINPENVVLENFNR